MPWVPIHESGFGYDFDNFGGGAEIEGSVVSALQGSASTYSTPWSLQNIDGPSGGITRIRITCVDYGIDDPNSCGDGSPFVGRLYWYDWQDDRTHEVDNEAGDPMSSWDPSPVVTSDHTQHIGFEWNQDQGECAMDIQFSFLIEVWVEGELVANDDEATTNAGTPVTVDVLANDTLDGAPVTLGDLAGPPTILSQPEFGEAVVEADGRITYTPPGGFVGEVEIPYMIETADAGCPELTFSNSFVPAEDVEIAVGGPVANNIYFEIGGITFNFHRTVDEEFWPDPGNYMPCNPSDWDLPEFPWQVDLYWGDGGGGVCVSITNVCF